jgi:hypothetical protein
MTLAAISKEFCILFANPPPINEFTAPEVIILPDQATIADNPLLISIVLFSPPPINDFSD